VSGFELSALVGFAEDESFQRNVLARLFGTDDTWPR
jgi:hypothetical protein